MSQAESQMADIQDGSNNISTKGSGSSPVGISSPVAAQIERDRKDSESKTRFNNQNSIFMATVTGDGSNYIIMMIHDTRIYYFQSNDMDLLDSGEKLDKVIDDITDTLLHLLTTTKYRILNAFYVLFGMIDQLSLWSLVSMTFYNSHNGSTLFQDVIETYWMVWLVLLIELLYTLMEYTVKIWILNRISVYIGIVLFILYASAFAYHDIWDASGGWVEALFILRAFAFIMEISVDFSLDLEVAVDLQNEWMTEMKPIFAWDSVQQTDHRRLNIPQSTTFLGSVCVWSWMNVFEINKEYFEDDYDSETRADEVSGRSVSIGSQATSVLHRKMIMQTCKSYDENGLNDKYHAHRICLYITLLLTTIVASPLLLVAIGLMAMFACLKFTFCRCEGRQCKNNTFKNTIWYEMTHEHSF